MSDVSRLSASSYDEFMWSMIDVDTHEMIPLDRWEECFGSAGGEFAELTRDRFSRQASNTMVRPDVTGDDSEITDKTVWYTKGPGAPGAIDFGRRIAVVDQMGVRKACVFPTFGLFSFVMTANPNAHEHFEFDPTKVDRVALGRRMAKGYSAWAASVTRQAPSDRIRVAGVLLTESVEQMITDLETGLSMGLTSFVLPVGTPPADTSPADRAFDPFWTLAVSAGATLVLHGSGGTQDVFLASSRWGNNVPEFRPERNSDDEFGNEPFRGSSMCVAYENFLSTMLLGGVFERHPQLRVGAIEVGAHWVGPLAEKLDIWAELYEKRLSKSLSILPSEYMARNVRATPFYMEPVDRYFRRYPELSDVYCYSSDYPHREGGRNAKQIFSERLAGADVEVRKKFFATNGEWLFPTAVGAA